MTHKTLVIDLDRCIGCYACEVACKNENSIPLGVHYNKVLTIGPLGKFPDIQQYFLPSVCQNCREAPCVKVCCANARFFGDIDDPNSDVSKAIAAAGPENVHSMPDSGNKPTVRYILHKKNAPWQPNPPKML